MGTSSSKSKKKNTLKIGSSKYKIVSVESTDDVITELIVCDSKTKEEYLLKKMLINSGSNTIDYLSGADILSRLPSHPNIVRYIGSSHFVHQDGSIEFALLTENSSSWLNLINLQESSLLNDFKLKLKAFEDICHAIQHCHKNSIAHLSIHPLNILQNGFGTFKITNFDSSIIINNGINSGNNNNFIHSSMSYCRNSIFSNNNINININNNNNNANNANIANIDCSMDDSLFSIFIAPELLDPKQYTAVLDNKLFEKGDIWSLGILLLYLLYDGNVPKWYTNKLGVREADCSMFLGSYASNFVKTNMIHSNPHKRITISNVLKFISAATANDNDPIKFLSSLSTPKLIENGKDNKVNKPYNNNPIDSMINKILKTNSQIFYNRLMVNFWDNNNDKDILQLMVERVYMSSSIICNRSSLMAIKLLTLLHRLFLQTPQEFMVVSINEIKFYNQLIEFWKIDSSQDFMKDLVISYAKFMISRLKFHSKNIMFESNFSLSKFMYNNHKNQYLNFKSNKWFDDISQSFIDLINFGTNHCGLINSILSHKGFNTSFATQYANAIDVGNILNNCLIPLFEDLHSLYCITTWIIGLLRISFGKKKISIYSDKYKDFMISLIAVVSRIQNTAMIVWNCIDIDTKQFPKSVPKISSIAVLDIYPPSSFAPNLSAFNRELVNYFVNIINTQQNNQQNNDIIQYYLKPDQIKSDEDEEEEYDDDSLSLKRAKTQKLMSKSGDDSSITPKNRYLGHNRSRSTHIQAKSMNNSRTPPPRNQFQFLHNSSPNLFPDIDNNNDEIQEEEDEDNEEEEVKEELSFRPLSRSLSSDTNCIHHPHSPSNPFATLPSTNRNGGILSSNDDVFVFNNKFNNNDDDESEEEKILKCEEKEEDELKWEDIIIIERIGIGGFAEVFSGKIRINEDNEFSDEFSDELDEKVAIKKLINQNLTQHNLTEFSSEIGIMRKIQHPNITKFIGACTKSPHMCIVTELLEMSLFDLLHNTRLKISIIIEQRIAMGATKGVYHLHLNNIIHRDLKSANILLDRNYNPRITDFGLSRMKDQSTLTAGTGTFQWMAPEVIQGKKYDEKSDIYSLAIIFWEIKTGLIPFISYRLNGIQASVAVVTQKKRPKIDISIFKNKLNYNKWRSLIIKMWNQIASLRPTANDVIKLLINVSL